MVLFHNDFLFLLDIKHGQSLWDKHGYGKVDTPADLWKLTRRVHNEMIDHFGLEQGKCRVVTLEPSGSKWKGEPRPHSASLFLVLYNNSRCLITEILVWLQQRGFTGKVSGPYVPIVCLLLIFADHDIVCRSASALLRLCSASALHRCDVICFALIARFKLCFGNNIYFSA